MRFPPRLSRLFEGVLSRAAVLGLSYLQGRSLLPRIRLDSPGAVFGTRKFWEATAGPDGLRLRLRLRWGPDGRQGQTILIAPDQCAEENPVRELVHRSESKLTEGYHLKKTCC